MNVMRELGIRGVRRGRTPVTTKPARGTGGRPDLVERRFEAEAPNRLHVADITYVRMANGSFGYTAFAADVFARRIVGWACATTMGTGELPLQALEQAMSWAASHGGTDGLVHRSDHGARCIGLVCTTGVGEFGMLPSAGTVGDSYDNAMAESADGACKTELVWRRKPFQDLRDLELATFRWVSWWGLEASAPVLGLQDTGTDRNRVLRKPNGASRPTIRAEQKTGHITRSAANCHAATIRAEQRWPRQPRRRAARASTIRSHEPAPPSSGLRQQNLRGEGAVLEVATQVAARSLDDLGDVDQPETVPLV